MAENVVLAPVTSFTNDSSAVATVNANSVLIENAFADCLSISGTSPNSMAANLDMNNFQIINLPAPATINSPVRLGDLTTGTTVSTANFAIKGSPNTFTATNTFSTNQLFTTAFFSGVVTINGLLTLGGGTLLATSVNLTNNSAGQTATMTNGPTAGNPTKWIPINDNGVTRNIPAW